MNTLHGVRSAVVSAMYTFDQPSLDWNKANLYQEFVRFKNHCTFVFKGPLSEKPDKDKSGWIGLWIGQQGREIYKTFNWTQDFDGVSEEDSPTAILQKFEDYILPRKNKRIARYKFSQRVQRMGESFDNFLKDLRILAMDCEYTDTDDMLVDNKVRGVYHKKVQERLLDKGQELTLDAAIQVAQQFELSRQQIRLMRGETDSLDKVHVNAIRTSQQKSHRSLPNKQQARKQDFQNYDSKLGQSCYRCGLSSYKGQTCPAVGTTSSRTESS